MSDLRAVPVFHDDDHISLGKLRLCDRRATVETCGIGLEAPGEKLYGCLAPVLASVADEEDVHAGTKSLTGI